MTFALEGFEMKPFTSSTGRTRDVYRTGKGPAVIIIHEIPGITPLVAAFARRIAERGMSAVMPSLSGTAGRPMTVPYALSSLARACVSKEFTLSALNETSPTVDHLRELAVHERQAHGEPGVGAPDFKRVTRETGKSLGRWPFESSMMHFSRLIRNYMVRSSTTRRGTAAHRGTFGHVRNGRSNRPLDAR